MAIKLECPRCKTPLQAPDKAAGKYMLCSQCKGRLWVPKEGIADGAAIETATLATSPNVPVAPPSPRPPASPTPPPSRATPPPASPPGTTPPAGQSLVPINSAQPSLPLPRSKVARFIAAEAADSSLKLAADGKLPVLHLDEGATKQKQERSERSVNPLVMVGVLTISVVLSIVVALMDVGTPPASGAGKKAEMRQKLEDHFFGSGALNAKRLEPYQILLRDAQQAYSRGDHRAQRDCYGKVLDLLRAERGSEEKGLTGSRSKDKELEEALLVLLSGG